AMPLPSLTGVSHLALTVTDLQRSVAWYVETLGFAELFPFDTEAFTRRILLHPSGAVVALTQHTAAAAGRFDPHVTGLDHVGFSAASVEDLEAWAQWLTSCGVEHAGVQVTPLTGSALVAFCDPDGIALEVYVQTALPAAR
ncbi:MAG: Glyoxalase/bleomycin resistance protein/dioxygenase, partial [Frankiales bacterium]|nr:Glyoxalase/bleomycin resistance protein/dioxygenase [Frankiales bacterium]